MKDQLPVLHWQKLLETIAKPKTKVLDVGAADGADSLMMKNLGAEVTAVDIDSGQAEKAARRGIRAKIADMKQLSRVPGLKRGEFDVVLNANTLVFLREDEEVRRVVEEMMMMVKPGGRLVICTENFITEQTRYGKVPPAITREGLPRVVTSLGLEIAAERVVNIPEKRWARRAEGYLVIEVIKPKEEGTKR